MTGFCSAVDPITGEYNFWLWHFSKPNCSLLPLPRSTRCMFPISMVRSQEESWYQTSLFRTVPTAVLQLLQHVVAGCCIRLRWYHPHGAHSCNLLSSAITARACFPKAVKPHRNRILSKVRGNQSWSSVLVLPTLVS